MDELPSVCVPVEYCLRVKFLIRLPEAETAREPVEHGNYYGEVCVSVCRSSEDEAGLFQFVEVGRPQPS